MIIVGADVETTGLEPDDQIVELGLVVYDTVNRNIVAMHSDLFRTTKWGEAAEKVHGIPQALSQLGYDADYNPWNLIAHYKPTLVIAHNKEYDKSYICPRWPEFDKLPWLCSKAELPHSEVISYVCSTRLQHLAVDYDIDSGRRHRALFDAITCCEVAAKHDLEKIVKQLLEPKFTIFSRHEGRPDFNNPDFNKQKEFLKLAGFRWDGDNVRWTKSNVPESMVEKYLALASAKPGWKAEQIAQ